MLYKVVLGFESVYKILRCHHSYGSYWATLSVEQGSFNFWVLDEIPKCDHSNEAVEQCFPFVCFVLGLFCLVEHVLISSGKRKVLSGSDLSSISRDNQRENFGKILENIIFCFVSLFQGFLKEHLCKLIQIAFFGVSSWKLSSPKILDNKILSTEFPSCW